MSENIKEKIDIKGTIKTIPMGLSGCGKDSFARSFGEQLISVTTRPPRYTGEASHVFVSEDEANQMTDRVAETIIDGYQYFATREQFEKCDVYVIDPKGLGDLCKRAPDVGLCVLYINASKDVRKQRAIDRAEDKEEAERVFDSRYEDEHQMFEDFVAMFESDDLNAFHNLYPTVKTVVVVDNEKNDLQSIQMKVALIKEHIDKVKYNHGDMPFVYRI